jgi:hypothetical protein
MSLEQIHAQFFDGASLQIASRRLVRMLKSGFIERRHLTGPRGSSHSVFLNTPKAIKAIANGYRYAITSELCKSDSVDHDLALVSIRNRIQKLPTITNYFTENMLQACGHFLESNETRPFVNNNTDAVIEITKDRRKLLVGLEFESSEKAKERYVRKLVSYYSDGRVPIILYVCTSSRIRNAVAQAEVEVVRSRVPKCFYSSLSDVLAPTQACTFTDARGAKVTLR